MKAVQTLLGHATAWMTLDLYSHLRNDSVTRAADLMAQGLAQAFNEVDPNAARRPEEEGREPAEKARGSRWARKACPRSWRCGRIGNHHDSDLRFCNGRGDRI